MRPGPKPEIEVIEALAPDRIEAVIKDRSEIVVRVPGIVEITEAIQIDGFRRISASALYRRYGNMNGIISNAGLRCDAENTSRIGDFDAGQAPDWVIDKAVSKFGAHILLDRHDATPIKESDPASLSTPELHKMLGAIALELQRRDSRE